MLNVLELVPSDTECASDGSRVRSAAVHDLLYFTEIGWLLVLLLPVEGLWVAEWVARQCHFWVFWGEALTDQENLGFLQKACIRGFGSLSASSRAVSYVL